MPCRAAALILAMTAGAALADPSFAPGTHGQPFSVQGLMQACVTDEAGDFCAIYAEGWRFIVSPTGPTPPELYHLLTVLPPNAPITLTGDMIDIGDITATVAVSDIKPDFDANARLRAMLQGHWASYDETDIVQIDGAEWSVSQDDNVVSVSVLQLRPACGDGAEQPAPVVVLQEMGGDPEATTCYRINAIGLDTLDLTDLSNETTHAYTRVP